MFIIEEPIIYYKSSEKMEEVPDNSVQLILTSPPYGKIKDYGSETQIGYYDSFNEYFLRLKNVWAECYRVLEPACRMVINVGDQYLRTVDFGRYRILSIASKIIEDCQTLGFDFLGDIIWQKISTTNTTGGCSLMGSIYYPRNGLLTFDYEHILIFKKHKGKARKIELEIKELSKISLSEWKKWFIGHWRFPGIIQKEHIAMFPEELPYRIIRMFSFIGDVILDPFLGAGTTLKVAKSLFRKGIGYEINKDFKIIIDNKLKQGKQDYFQDYQYLLYKIYNKTKRDKFKILFEKQKQKGIIILKNIENVEILIDYFLFEGESTDIEHFENEIKAKLTENTLQNYIKEKTNWSQFKNYIIIINSKPENNVQLKEKSIEIKNSYNLKKKVQILTLNEIIADNFQISRLFN